MTMDMNGNAVTKSVRRESDGTWGATVWFGGGLGPATDVRRYYYMTRRDARAADISDVIGQRGRVI